MFLAFGVITLLMICAVPFGLHYNKIEDIQVIQSPSGEVTVRRDAGFYLAWFSKVSTYPKASLEYCSNKPEESRSKDAPMFRFSNKSQGWLNCQIGYRIDGADDKTFLKLHEWAHGEDEIIWRKVLTKLQDCCQIAASKITPSDAIEKYTEFTTEIRALFIANKDLAKFGIQTETFDCSGQPDFDPKTKQLFESQLQADLMKKTAEAEKVKLITEKERTIAQYYQ